MNNSHKPPKQAEQLLRWFIPSHLKDALIGDLKEEYSKKKKINSDAAKNWYWRQSMLTAMHYISRYLGSEDLLRKLTILITIIIFPTFLILISWLSNMDHASDEVWNSLLEGKVHEFIFTTEVWVNGLNKFIEHLSFDMLRMYIHFPSLIWAGFTFLTLLLRNKLSSFTAHQAAAWGFVLMLFPYILGLIAINMGAPDPKAIGPTVAFMTLSIVYILPLLMWLIIVKTRDK